MYSVFCIVIIMFAEGLDGELSLFVNKGIIPLGDCVAKERRGLLTGEYEEEKGTGSEAKRWEKK